MFALVIRSIDIIGFIQCIFGFYRKMN